MRFLISIIVLSLALTNCGFNAIYCSKNNNFEIVEIINKNENKNSFAIETIILSLSNKKSSNKLKLELDYKHLVTTILKDSKGDPSKKKLSIIVNLNVKDEKNNVITNKSFNEEFSYNVQSDKFGMAQYENNITDNLNNKISNDIIFLLGTLNDS